MNGLAGLENLSIDVAIQTIDEKNFVALYIHHDEKEIIKDLTANGKNHKAYQFTDMELERLETLVNSQITYPKERKIIRQGIIRYAYQYFSRIEIDVNRILGTLNKRNDSK